MMTNHEEVSSPAHYRGNGKIECMDAMASMMYPADVKGQEAFWWGCAFKYLWRWPLKNSMKDLLKAKQCIDYLIEKIQHKD